MTQFITCVSVGSYESALTRGRQYELLAYERDQVKICGDNSRTRWFPVLNFDLLGGLVPLLLSWWFDDPVLDVMNNWDETNNYVDVSFNLSDGQTRWLSFAAPDYLKQLLEPRDDPAHWGGAYEPGIWGSHLVVVRDLKTETVKWMLTYLDQQGELVAHSRPLTE